MRRPLMTLLTDFGLSDHYVAEDRSHKPVSANRHPVPTAPPGFHIS